MQIDLKGKHAVVTGGGRGIGEAVARSLCEANARVTIVDREAQPAASVSRQLDGSSYVLDISKAEDVERVVGTIEATEGPIDILVNCAGNLQNLDRPEDLPLSVWDRITDVHLRGTYVVTTCVGIKMAARRAGAIVTIASTAGMRSTPLHAYAPAKAALISMTECLAAEWGWAGVRANAISPGFVETPGVSRGFAEGVMDPERCKSTAALGRLVHAREVATTAVFLVSDLSSGITGANIPVDAGWLAGSSWTAYGGLRHSRTGEF